MPELPEVERARNVLQQHAAGKIIEEVEAFEDAIVFSGSTHLEFADEIRGRLVKGVYRYGKVFYLQLTGEGKMPVMHFGMTGNVIIKGETPLYYKEGPKKVDSSWPPRFSKFILHLKDPDMTSTQDTSTEVAFVDARRLGRIRLCKDPMGEPPISLLGFDPLLKMATLKEFSEKVLKRGCPIKALFLDQSFSAGVGNWVADEILYHAHVHPEQRSNTLSQKQIEQLHQKMIYVCQTAVRLNADSTKFPENWLFNHRWGKGKSREKGKSKDQSQLLLPSGAFATLKWLTVGGRTSAYVVELQCLPSTSKHPDPGKRDLAPLSREDSDQESGLSELTPPPVSEESDDNKLKNTSRRKRQKLA